MDWTLLAGAAVMWGSSFLLIEVGLDDLHPAAVTLLRLLFGAATLAAIPAARRRVPPSALAPITLLGLVWMGVCRASSVRGRCGPADAPTPAHRAPVLAGRRRCSPGARRPSQALKPKSA